jgi:hypothetical protein
MSGKLGPRTFGHKEEMVFLGREISEQRDYSEEVARQIDEEVQAIIEGSHQTARNVLTEHREDLKKLAEKLIARETLEGKELEEVFDDMGLPPKESEVEKKPVPAPVKPVGEAEKSPKPKQAPGVPRLVPKQTTTGPE